jgi:hypothetical protein
MGNCSKKHFVKRIHDARPDFRASDSPEVIFNVILSKVAISSLPSAMPKPPVYISFTVGLQSVRFGEANFVNDRYKWDEIQRFTYKTSLGLVKSAFLRIAASAAQGELCTGEIAIKSIVTGPVHQNIGLFGFGNQAGRASFDIELLQETSLIIRPEKLAFQLDDQQNAGHFATNIKFSSELAEESKLSEIAAEPVWTFNEDNKIGLKFSTTIFSLRDAALQIQLIKQKLSQFELVSECWISFTKMFSHENKGLIHQDSFCDKSINGSPLQLNELKAELTREYHIDVDEELWLFGRKTGRVTGLISIVGMPIFTQMPLGIHSEHGVTFHAISFSSCEEKKSHLPLQMKHIQSKFSQLKLQITRRNSYTGPESERKLCKELNSTISELCSLIKSAQDEIIEYSSSKSLIASQELIIELGKHLIHFAPLVNYIVKPQYFRCLSLVLTSNELDIQSFLIEDNEKVIGKKKKKVALDYLEMLHSALCLALSRLDYKGAHKSATEFIDRTMMLCWFRVPAFRDAINGILKMKSFGSIPEWRKIEFDLDFDEPEEDSFAWNHFYELIPPGYTDEKLWRILEEDSWREGFAKREVVFFRFFEKLICHMEEKIAATHCPANLLGCNILLKAFLNELKNRKINLYPEALVSCCQKLIIYPSKLNIIVRILFSKANIYEIQAFQETFKILDNIFMHYHALHKKLHHTFDFHFFALGIEIALKSDIGVNIAKCLWFLYNHYSLISGWLRERIINEIMYKKCFKRFLFHWCFDVRNMMMHLIQFRILAARKVMLEESEENAEFDEEMRVKVKRKIKKLRKARVKDKYLPYALCAFEELDIVKENFCRWFAEKCPAGGVVVGCSMTLKYPDLKISFSGFDLSEKRLGGIS